jgi:DNA-binding NarL/FixJ family response regulator
MTIACLVIDDHYLFRRGLIGTLLSLPGAAVVGEANSVERALAVPDEPDVVLLDLSLEEGGMMKEAAVRSLLKRWPRTHILILTASESRDDLIQMLAAGASGYVTKHAKPSELAEALQAVSGGKVFVTPRLASYLLEDDGSRPNDQWSLSGREREILKLVAEGERDREISERFGTRPGFAAERISPGWPWGGGCSGPLGGLTDVATGVPCGTNGEVRVISDRSNGAKTGSPRGMASARHLAQNPEGKVTRHADPRHKGLTVRDRRRSIAAISCLVAEIPG